MNNSSLRRIQNWRQVAPEVGYSVKELARCYGLSVRVLERLFLVTFGHPPRECLKHLRMVRAIALLQEGSNVNETAGRLGYKDRSHFSRDFKRCYGNSPKRYTKVLARVRKKAQKVAFGHINPVPKALGS
jgi:AraC-like DNA-binding protein